MSDFSRKKILFHIYTLGKASSIKQNRQKSRFFFINICTQPGVDNTEKWFQ